MDNRVSPSKENLHHYDQDQLAAEDRRRSSHRDIELEKQNLVEHSRHQEVYQPSSSMAQRTGSSQQHLHPDSAQEEESAGLGCCGTLLFIFSIFLLLITFPLSLCVTLKVVQEYERAVIFRLGRLLSGGAQGPGMFFIVPCTDTFVKVDLRTISFNVPPQEVLSKDSVTVTVDAVVYYNVFNPVMSVNNVSNAAESTQLLAQTTLRNVLGTRNLADMLSDRDQITSTMQSMLDEATDKWGIKVERVEIKDVSLPKNLQRAMAAEAEASRDARAKVIAAEGEHSASRALKDAADVISESPAAMQLRYLQTMHSISAEKNSTILFPVPIDFMSNMMQSMARQ